MDKRPVNLNLFTIRFPITALVSISHRISGIVLFLAIPLVLAVLSCSLQSNEGFLWAQALLSHSLIRLLAWLLSLAFFYHLLAGIRHLLMDCHLGESLQGGKWTARVVWVVFVLVAIFLTLRFF